MDIQSYKTEFSPFADAIRLQKYAHTLPDGSKETWADTAKRVATNVMKSVSAPRPLVKEIEQAIFDRKFIPGGRYLYAAGRKLHQVNNCFSGSTRFITDQGIRSLEEMSGQNVSVFNKRGEWEAAEVKCFDEQQIVEMHLTNGTVIETTEGHLWPQLDGSSCTTADSEEVLLSPAYIGRNDLCREGIQHGIIFGDGHLVKDRHSVVMLCGEKKQELADFFDQELKEVIVGFGAKLYIQTIRKVKAGTIVSLQPKHYKTELPTLRGPMYARSFIAGLIATDGCVPTGGSVQISCEGLAKAKTIAEIAVLGGCVVTSVKVTSTVSPFDGSPRELATIFMKPYSVPVIRTDQVARLNARRLIVRGRAVAVDKLVYTDRCELVYCVIAPITHTFTLACGILTSNCLMCRAVDSREGWAEHLSNHAMGLMTGAGMGTDYSEIREAGALIGGMGGQATGPCSLALMTNEVGRGIQQGGSRRAALWAGLKWSHPDIFQFINLKNWSTDVVAAKKKDFNACAPMDMTNISVILDDEFFTAYGKNNHPKHELAYKVYWTTVRHMLETGEPGFSVNVGADAGETLRNACTELTSHDDSDVCNLGSLNLARIRSLEEMKRLTEISTAFLLAGTVYSDLPYAKVGVVREKNRRLGLGLMGIHEWLLINGKKYGPDSELEEYLKVYKFSGGWATAYAHSWGLSNPVKTRAIAPTGSIGILAETTTGIEPIFCVAYKRRYLDGTTWKYQYVVDPTAQALIDRGVKPELIEDAYTLAKDVERRVGFQAWVQKYVDHSISSTVNLPSWGTELNNEGGVLAFGNMLLKYLPGLRGLTVYPDGARSGQPITPVHYSTAVKHPGQIFFEQADICEITSGGTCGS